MQLVKLVFFVSVGALLAWWVNVSDIPHTGWYALLTGALLALGLYSSTFGIVIKEARQHLRLILTAITVGVIVKAIIIGGILALVFHGPVFMLFGIVVAQIDPLSTSALMHGSRLSAKAKTILAAWSSFDDPVTVILSLYAPAFLTFVFGGHWEPVTGVASEAGIIGYLKELGVNLGFAAIIFAVYWFVKQGDRKARDKLSTGVLYAFLLGSLGVATYVLLLGSLSVAAYFFLMLGIAVIGLFLRPNIEKTIAKTVEVALMLSAVLLGMLLVYGINFSGGLVMGAAAFGAQILVGFLLTFGLPKKDRVHIAFAQQNGITAIILALLFESSYPGTVAIVAPAILVTNALHFVTNKLLDNYAVTKVSAEEAA